MNSRFKTQGSRSRDYIIIFFLSFAFCVLPCLPAGRSFEFSFAAEMKYGSLNVFSKIPNARIYVDGDPKGVGSAMIKEIQAGTHFIKATSGEATPEATIFAEVVEIKAGEVTTIYISEKGAQETTKAIKEKEEVDVFKVKRVIDYSKEMHTGWYAKLSYLTNLYYNLYSPTLDRYASAFALSLGFQLPLAPGIDFSLELERAEMSSATTMWYFMPITANIKLSYLPSPYFRGKQYYGLGIGYYQTNLETELKQNLSAVGYHLFYGLEMPSGDMNAFFIEFGYHAADLSRYNYTLNSTYASVGYRWDVKDKE